MYVNRLHTDAAAATSACPRWQPQFYDRVRTPRNRKVSCADNLYPGVLNLALQWIPLEIRVIGYFRSFDGRENIQWVLCIVFALGKHDKRINAIVSFFSISYLAWWYSLSCVFSCSLTPDKNVTLYMAQLFQIMYNTIGYCFKNPFFHISQTNNIEIASLQIMKSNFFSLLRCALLFRLNSL